MNCDEYEKFPKIPIYICPVSVSVECVPKIRMHLFFYGYWNKYVEYLIVRKTRPPLFIEFIYRNLTILDQQMVFCIYINSLT